MATSTAPTRSKRASAAHTTERPRRIKTPKRHLYKRQDKRFRARRRLPSAWRLTGQAWRLLRVNWRLIGGIMLIYAGLNIVLVQGLNGGADVRALKAQLNSVLHGFGGHLASGAVIFGQLLTSSSTPATAEASAYQTFLLIIVSLAVVWTYRELLAGHRLRIRDGFYQGMQPLIPVVLVLLVVFIQLIPLIVGLWLYAALVSTSVVSGFEVPLTGLVSLGLASISIYWVCSSLFALYIAALPGMTPVKALRSSRELVRYRRWPLIRKLLWLPLILLLVGALVMIPTILLVPIIAQWVFFALSTLALAVVHAYLYTLYRELLND